MFALLSNDHNKDLCRQQQLRQQQQQQEKTDDGVKPCSLNSPQAAHNDHSPVVDVETGGKAMLLEGTKNKAAESSSTTCPVCFDPLVDNKQAIQVQPCGHTFCRDCLAACCEYHISIHRVPVPCPMILETMVKDDDEHDHDDDSPSSSASLTLRKSLSSSLTVSAHGGCPEYLSPALVEQVLQQQQQQQNDSTAPDNSSISPQESPLWSKYQRLQRLASDPSLVSCTRCDEVVPADPSTSTNSRTCLACQHVFCAMHGDAHLGQSSCPQNDNDDDNDDAFAQNLPQGVKPCSHCQVPIVKFAGCDHMVCPQCQNDMCFKCGTHLVREWDWSNGIIVAVMKISLADRLNIYTCFFFSLLCGARKIVLARQNDTVLFQVPSGIFGSSVYLAHSDALLSHDSNHLADCSFLPSRDAGTRPLVGVLFWFLPLRSRVVGKT